ncbi:4Fe-4S dicluster domain-containing protein [Chloroflexota bacterium]
MAEKILVIDPEKCTGCRKCEVVCSVFHNGASNPGRSRIRVIKWENIGLYLPVTCQNCDDAFCTDVCPAKACHRDPETNKIVIDGDICIGCKTCIIACPFGVPFFDKVDHVSVKCDFCDGNPQCVASCETKAIDYVDLHLANKYRLNEQARNLAQLTGYGNEERTPLDMPRGFGIKDIPTV